MTGSTLIERLAGGLSAMGRLLLARSREGSVTMETHAAYDGQLNQQLQTLPADQVLRLAFEGVRDEQHITRLLEQLLRPEAPRPALAADLLNRLFLPRYADLALEVEPQLIGQLAPMLQLRIASASAGESVEKEAALLLAYPWDGQLLYATTLLEHANRRVRERAIAYLARQGEPVRDWMLSLLEHPDADARHAALQVLQRIGGQLPVEQLRFCLEQERAAPVRQALADLIGFVWDSDALDRCIVQVIAEAERVLPGRRKAPLSWCNLSVVSPLRWRTGVEVPEKVTRALFVFQSYALEGQLSQRVEQVRALLDQSSGSPLAQALLAGWLRRGAPTQEAWCLPLLCALGDAALVPAVIDAVDKQISSARTDTIARLIKASLYLPHPTLLRYLVELAMSRRSRNVRQVASSTLASIAASRGMTEAELADFTVPQLGFEAQSGLRLDYGRRHFDALPDLQRGLLVVAPSGKQIKELPSPGVRDDVSQARAARERFQACRKAVRRVLRLESARLEQAMITGQRWTLAHWRAHLLSHPLLRLYAQSLVWGLLDEAAGGYQLLFRASPDGAAVGVDGQPLQLPAQGSIRLVHLVELDATARQAWATHQRESGLVQPFAQLERPICVPGPEHAAERAWELQHEVVLDENRFARQCSRAGWMSAPEGITRRFEACGIQVVQQTRRLTDLFLFNRSYTRHIRLQQLFFLRYDPATHSTDPFARRMRALPLADVPPVVLSEAALEIATLVRYAVLRPEEAAAA